jgi:hypothetical protein
MTIDPSAHHRDPVGEAFSHTSQQAAQFISMADAAYEIAARRKAIRNAREAARTQQQLQAAEGQEKVLRQAARARWAPALSAQWLAQADLVQAGRVWGAAAVYADSDPQAAAALRKAEERMRALHPYAMSRYDRLRYEGARPLAAMRNAIYLFAREPHARPGQPAAPRPVIERGTPGAAPWPDAGQAPGAGAPEPAPGPDPSPDPSQGALQRGQQIAAQLQDRALVERGSQLSPDELAVALEATTTLPAEVIARLARVQDEENTAARAAGLDRGQSAVPAQSSASGPTAAWRDTAAAAAAGVHAPAGRSAALLAAESFPRTTAEGIQAAVSGRLRQPGASQSRTAAVQKTRRNRSVQ